jgi:hypothetical protein
MIKTLNFKRMKIFRNILTLFFSISLVCNLSNSLAQRGSNCPEDLKPKYGANKMWGYVNLFDQWVINPSYTKVSPYVENKAVVMKGLSYGVIDCEGNVILAPQYDKLTNFRYGKIWAKKKDGLWGLLNEKGGIVLEHQYSEINPIAFTELTWVKKDNLWGLLNEEKGNFICKPQYKIAQVMSENATLVQLTEPNFGVVNHVNCEYLLPLNITKVKKVAAHTIIFQQQGKWGVFNEWGKLVANAEYDSLAALKTVDNELLLLSEKNNLYGLISLSGKELVATQYDEIATYSNGFFRVKQKGKYGFVNRAGKVYIKPQYDEASSFADGQAIVKKNGKYGVIDFKNQFKLQPKYSSIIRNPDYKYYAIKENDKTGSEKIFIYDLNGKKITDEAFDQIYIADSIAQVRVVKNGKTKFFNVNTKVYAFDNSYDQAEAFKNGYAFVSNGGKWGAIDKQGKVIVPVNYDKVEFDWFANKMIFKTTLNGKQGIIDQKAKVILPNEYDMIVSSLPIYLKVKKDGKYGVLKNDGTPITEIVYDFISNQIESTGIPEWPSIIIKKDKYGLLNEKGEEIYQPKAMKIDYVGEGNYSVKEKKNCGLLNSKCSNEYNPQYDVIGQFGEGLAAARKNGKWGYITSKGEEKIKPQLKRLVFLLIILLLLKLMECGGLLM